MCVCVCVCVCVWVFIYIYIYIYIYILFTYFNVSLTDDLKNIYGSSIGEHIKTKI